MATVFKFPFTGKRKRGVPAPRAAKTALTVPRQGGAVEIAYGVAWSALTGIGSLSEQGNKLARVNKSKAYVVCEADREEQESLVGLLKAKVGKRRVVPAASLFAAELTNKFKASLGLYLGPHDAVPGQFCIIGILQSMPSPSFDRVGSAAQVLDIAEDYGSYAAEGAHLFIHESLRSNPLFDEYISRHQIAEFVPSLPGSSLASDPNQPVFTDAGINSIKTAIIGATALLVLGGASYAAWNWYSTEMDAQAKKRADVARNLKLYVSTRDAKFNESPTFLASKAAPVLWDKIRQTRDNRAGWRLTTITCTGVQCTLLYALKKDATFKGIVKTVGAAATAKLELPLLETSSVDEPVVGMEAVEKLSLADMQATPDLTVSFGSSAQVMKRAGLDVAITSTSALGDVTAMQKLGASNTTARKVGTWKVVGPVDVINNRNTFVDAMNRLPPNAVLTSVEFKLNDGGSDKFSASGRYITR